MHVAPSAAGLCVQYARDGVVETYDATIAGLEQSFVFEELPAGDGDLIDHHLQADVVGAIALWNRLEIGLAIPVTLYMGAGDLADQGVLDPKDAPGKGGDIDSALDAIYAVGDDPSVPWQAPDAHGTGDERADAFGTGYDGGVDACADQYAPGFSEER